LCTRIFSLEWGIVTVDDGVYRRSDE